MRVLVAPSVFADSANTSNLARLLTLAVERRHDVLVTTDAREKWEEWLDNIGSALGSIYRRAEMDSHKRQAPRWSRAEVIIDDDPEDPASPAHSLSDALRLLETPLSIGVEDETSDRLFLDTVVPPAMRAQWQELKAQRAIVFYNIGGIPNVKRRLETLANNDPHKLRRLCIVLDSDAPEPWAEREDLPRQARAALAEAEKHSVWTHVLKRRMIENYLPIQALRAWVNTLGVRHRSSRLSHIDVFARLSRLRRHHHHHLKSGLQPKEDRYYEAESLSPEEREALRLGLDNGKHFKSHCCEAFAHATEAQLRSDGVHDEVAPIFTHVFEIV